MSGAEFVLMPFMVALGIGLFIGLDRERSKGEGPARSAAGIRTFAVASLLGAVSVRIGGDALLAGVIERVRRAFRWQKFCKPSKSSSAKPQILSGCAMSYFAVA